MTPFPADRSASDAQHDTTAAAKPPFDDVVSAHGATVLRLCRAVLSPPAADQAWIEAFLTAMGAYPQLPDGSSVVRWLLTIAERTIDHARMGLRHNAHGDTVPDFRAET